MALLLVATFSRPTSAQQTTLLPDHTIVGIANTVSGARALNNLLEFTGYNHDRTVEEWADKMSEGMQYSPLPSL